MCILPTKAKTAATLLDKTIAGCIGDEVEEIASRSHPQGVAAEILAHHDTGASNGRTEAPLKVG